MSETQGLPEDISAVADTDPAFGRVPNVALMRYLIEREERLVGGVMVCAHAGHCAIGTFAHFAGVPDAVLTMASSPSGFASEDCERFFSIFGIDSYDCGRIIESNDSINDEKVWYSKSALREDVDAGKYRVAARIIETTPEIIAKRKRVVLDMIAEIASDERLRLHYLDVHTPESSED